MRKPNAMKRAKQIRAKAAKKSLIAARVRKQEAAKRKRIALEAKAKATLPYSLGESILLVGEGDFSFTQALVSQLRAGGAQDGKAGELRVVSTCLDSLEQLAEKYPTALDNVAAVRSRGVVVIPGVDGTRLHAIGAVKDAMAGANGPSMGGFDKVVFNFPHTGCGIQDTEKNNKVHAELVLGFLQSAARVLNKGPRSEIHLTVKRGEPYDSWGVARCVRDTGVLRVKDAPSFHPHLYPGYTHRRTLGAAFVTAELGGPSDNSDITKQGARTYRIVFKDEALSRQATGGRTRAVRV